MGESVLITTDFFQCLVLLICAMLFHFFYHHPAKEAFRMPYLWLLVFISLCTMGISFLAVDNSSHGAWIAVLLLIMNFFNFYVYQKDQKLHEEQYRSRMMEKVDTIRRLEEKQKNNSLMNYELTQAKQLGTEILSHIALPAQLQVSPFDMTIILGNLLDNAVRALEQADRKILKTNIRYNKGIICIEIENTYSEHASKKRGRTGTRVRTGDRKRDRTEI